MQKEIQNKLKNSADNKYNLGFRLMTELELKIYEIVRQIPLGKVCTYGKIAEIAGNRKLARVVGNVMHKNPVPFWNLAKNVGYGGNSDEEVLNSEIYKKFLPVPCHRVVNSEGKMGANFGLGGPEIQAAMLIAEGVEVSLENLKINNLALYSI